MTDLTGTLAAAESAFTRCAICARPARRGATLCAQCKAAVKRARQVPSLHSEFLPQANANAGATAFLVGGHRRATRALAARSTGVPGAWGTYAALAVFGIALSIAAVIAVDAINDASAPAGDPPVAPAPVVDMRADSSALSQPAESLPAGDTGAGSPAVDVLPEPKVSRVTLGPTAGTVATRNPVRSAVSPSVAPAIPVTDPPIPDGERDYIPPATSKAVAAVPSVPAVQVKAPAAPSRLQIFTAATERCERDGGLFGFACKERARLDYCDGQWGDAPQCPVAPKRDTR